jgi:hypothetical protein
MTSSYVVAVECEGFQALDPPDPPNFDRKHDDRDPKVVEKQRKAWQEEAEEQRALVLDTLDAVTNETDVRLVDKLMRDDGTAILYFAFDPRNEGAYFRAVEQVELPANFDPEKGAMLPARHAFAEVDAAEPEAGAVTWDSGLRVVEAARSACVGAGVVPIEVRVEEHELPKRQSSKSSSRSSSNA